MWINDELIEADVVERQRARQIYETILREKRDPAPLEWSGGNVFKASVFPIFGNSEKRIKITYTQVLPILNGRYHYTYALQSELLKQTPLRELSVDVQVASSLPIVELRSPSHATRKSVTAHAGRLEYAAQEVVPERDFEVVVDVGNEQSDVVVIPHQRGDDGYFMLQLMPPSNTTADDRGLIADGVPLELLIVADTSASLDANARQEQAELIRTLLMSLSPQDRVNVAVADVACEWLFDASETVTADRIQEIEQRLRSRRSLGWSDHVGAFRSVQQRSGATTHVIYVGDGIPATETSDPAEVARQLQQLFSTETQPTVHAVSVGNTYESMVLKAMSTIGGGSYRSVSAALTPSQAAQQLLAEIANPGLTDLKLEIEGVLVARIYPERLPNLSAGSQQILVGRYLPKGENQQGKVIVTGRQGDKAVRYEAPFDLREAQSGNSFVPRLWARQHLDHLLNQGDSLETRDEIIGLSEQFHIITPLTSLLVLESDADRERFKVKRRFRMRDGERYFAEGRQEANFDLKRQEMKRASDWRLELRRAVLRNLATLGRNDYQLQPQTAWETRGGDIRFSPFMFSYGVGLTHPMNRGAVWGMEPSDEEEGYFGSKYATTETLSKPLGDGDPATRLANESAAPLPGDIAPWNAAGEEPPGNPEALGTRWFTSSGSDASYVPTGGFGGGGGVGGGGFGGGGEAAA